MFKNWHLYFLHRKKSPLKKKTYFKIHKRWGSLARLLRVVTVERVKSMCIQLSLISAAGHPLHQAVSPLKKTCAKKKLWMSFFNPLLFSNCFFVFFGFLCFARSTKKLIAKNHFSLCSFPCFYSHVYCLFFSLLMLLSRGSDDRRQNTSPREMSEGSGGNGQQSLTRRSLVGVFFSMTGGLSWWTWINQRECIGWWFLARLGSNGVFLVIEWLVCDTDSPRDIRWWMLIIISLCCLSPLLFSSCLTSFLNTWQKVGGKIAQLEAVKLNVED